MSLFSHLTSGGSFSMTQSINDEESEGDTSITESKTVVDGLIGGTTANDNCERVGHGNEKKTPH